VPSALLRSAAGMPPGVATGSSGAPLLADAAAAGAGSDSGAAAGAAAAAAAGGPRLHTSVWPCQPHVMCSK
jgi:hypothetical protein